MNTITIVILAMGSTTIITRGLPFFLFKKNHSSPTIVFLGKFLPAVTMTLLIVFCLKDVEWIIMPYGIPEIAGILVTSVVHLWKRKFVFSIFIGTLSFVLLSLFHG